MGVFNVLLAISMIFPRIIGCSLLQQEARHKLEHMGMEILTQCEYGKKEECGPNQKLVGDYRVKQEVLSQIGWDNTQFSYHFKLIYSLCRKIAYVTLPFFMPRESGKSQAFLVTY